MIRSLLLASAACALAFPAAAETVAIVNARLEPVSSPAIPNGTLVIKDGKIAALGASIQVPAGARVIDAKGGVVTPGLIAPSSNLGASEISGVRETRDDGTGSALSAAFDISYGVNPASTFLGLARDGGITGSAVTPVLSGTGGGAHEHADDGVVEEMTAGAHGDGDPPLFGGQAAFIRLKAGSPDIVEARKLAVTVSLGESGARAAGGSRGANLVLLRSALEDARAFASRRAAFEQGATRDFGLSRLDLQALIPVVQGKTPLLIRVSRAADIRQALKLAAEERIKIVLEGVEEGWMVADEIAKAGVPVILDPQDDLPGSFETLGSRLDNAARLHAAGVSVAINGSRDFNNLRQERLNAGLAVAHGLPYPAALAAVTLVPARIWGQADKVGSLEVGKLADVVVWNGDPLETTSWPTTVLIGGVEQPKDGRHEQLKARYAASDQNGYPPAYR
ncbi:amidohydrolase [Caulobacter vibrioides]|uniref:amidohydrolase family protein n=1 Tax=Caulobacter vibrioides TaxID=155892 RepID=UPI000BB48899|nr:amidohydrolase family protein [Caulobacter vibrioides]ATC24935.1 amidohydrolase [Caulobacter vibrioides]AZH13090.1 amidohydrolase [Caulobacter vibrioides]PLR09713.1 amidohydrolase [Caulobacter vibrioides]